MNEKKGKTILIFAEKEQDSISLKKVVYEIGAKAWELAGSADYSIALVYPENELPFNEICKYSFADYVYHYPSLNHFEVRSYTQVICQLIKEINPPIVLLGATPTGRILAPRIAARLKVGLTADCTALELSAEGLLQQIRPAFGGNIMATIVSKKTRPQMATVRPHVFPLRLSSRPEPSIITKDIPLSLEHQAVEIIGNEIKNFNNNRIEEAKILVSFGRGIGKKENIDLLKEFALRLNAGISCSRAIVEMGWLEHAYQVGQSGKIVTPDLYIAIGISGAVQHLVGIRSSKKILAINKDPLAPIFRVADLGIIGDYQQVVPRLLNEINSLI